MSDCLTKLRIVVDQVDLVSVYEKDGKLHIYTLAAGGGETIIKLSPALGASLISALADWFRQAHADA